MGRDSESPLSPLSLSLCRQKEEARVSAVSWPPPTHQQKRPQEETCLAGTLILTSSPKTAVLAGGEQTDWVKQSRSLCLSVGTDGSPLSWAHGQEGNGPSTAGALWDDVLRVQAENGPWRGSVSCTDFAPSLHPSKAQLPSSPWATGTLCPGDCRLPHGAPCLPSALPNESGMSAVYPHPLFVFHLVKSHF